MSSRIHKMEKNQNSQASKQLSATYLQEITDCGLGKIYSFRGNKALIGRSYHVEVPVFCNTISRIHALFERSDNLDWSVTDISSTIGVYVEQQKLKHSTPFPLKNGVIISLGSPDVAKHKFMFQTNSACDESNISCCCIADPAPSVCKVEGGTPGCSSSIEDPEWRLAYPLKRPASQSVCDIPKKKYLYSYKKRLALQEKEEETQKRSQGDPEQLQQTVNAEVASEFEKIMDTELTCSICTELFIKATTLKCAHTFCSDCLKKWKKLKQVCPICRTPISSATHTLVIDSFIDKLVGKLSPEDQEKRKSIVQERMIAINKQKEKEAKRNNVYRPAVHSRYLRVNRLRPPRSSPPFLFHDVLNFILTRSFSTSNF